MSTIIRRFETGNVFDARSLAVNVPAPGGGEDDATLTWSGSAEAKWTEEPQPVMLGFTAEWKEDTSRRRTDTVRVTSKTDNDVFVDVERTREAVFVNSKTHEELKLKSEP